jgi:hypothetical protein
MRILDFRLNTIIELVGFVNNESRRFVEWR